MTRFARLFADVRGSSIIEMGLVAPFLCAMLVGMVDLSRAYSTKLQVEQAAQRTIEKIQVTSYQSSQDDAIKAEAAAAAGVAAENVVITSWLQCNNTSTKLAYTASCSGTDPYARYVQIQITKSYTPFFRMKWNRTTSGIWTVRGTAGIRTQ